MHSGLQYVQDICKKRNISRRQLEMECGFSNGYLDPKKIKRIPYERAVLIADYLKIDVNFVLNGPEAKNTPPLTDKDERDIARRLNAIMEDLASSGDLMFDGDPMSPEAVESVRDALAIGLRTAKILNKETYTPKKYRKE